MPSNAVFNSSLTYTPGGGGSLTQPFAVTVSYAAISAGTIDIAAGAAATHPVPFGSVGAANGLLLRNNTAEPVGIRLNGTIAGTDFQIAPKGVLTYFAPKPAPAALATPLTGAFISILATTTGGSVDFIVLGD